MPCYQPFQRKDLVKPVDIPCGRCPECLKRKISGWSFRLIQEEKKSTSAYFLTLTYDTATVPLTASKFMNLDKRDVQLFFKKLRKTHSSKLKYYLCGEYGSKTNRPHYHVILFNARVDLIQPAWQHGSIHYGSVSGASIGYTLKYISKPKRIPLFPGDDRLPEFSLMSKGLGAQYLTPQMIAWHQADLENRLCHKIEGNKTISMPRYYKQKIYQAIAKNLNQDPETQEKTIEQLKTKISLAAATRHVKETDDFNNHPDFHQRYADREQAKISAYKKMEIQSKKNDKF